MISPSLTLARRWAPAALIAVTGWALSAAAVMPGQAAAQTAAAGGQGAKPAAQGKPVAKGSAKKSQPKAAPGKAGPVANRNTDLKAAAAAAPRTPTLEQGCMDDTTRQWLSTQLAGGWAQAQQGLGLPAAEGGDPPAPSCILFATARLSPTEIHAVAVLPARGPSLEQPSNAAMLFDRAQGQAWAARPLELAGAGPAAQEVWVAGSGLAQPSAFDAIPRRWQREIDFFLERVKAGSSDLSSGWLRMVLADPAEANPLQPDAAQLLAMEWISRDGSLRDSVMWLERDQAPGGFISLNGEGFERMLWKMPLLEYSRISRGVGAARVVFRKRIQVIPKSGSRKPRTVVRSFMSQGVHEGVDFAAPTGTPIIAVAAGKVAFAGWNGGYGNLVIIDHGAGVTTYYAHLSAFGEGIDEGAPVARGQVIGSVGSTGRSTGPHLHYEIRHAGKYIDPANARQALPNWGLEPDAYERVLARMLSLSLTRAQGLKAAMATDGSRPAEAAVSLAAQAGVGPSAVLQSPSRGGTPP